MGLKKIIILMTAALIMAITNSSREEYVAWAQQKAIQSTNGFTKDMVSFFGDSVIERSTDSVNFVFFTLYKTEVQGEIFVATIGVFHNFIPFKVINLNSQMPSN